VCLLLRRACSTLARDRAASSSSRKISRRSAGMKQKSVMRSGRPFSTNWDTTLGWTKLSLRTFSPLRAFSLHHDGIHGISIGRFDQW
jgi:hypothetical protein